MNAVREWRQALQDVKQGKRHGVYVLYGEEPWLMDEFVRQVTAHLVPEEVRDLNVDARDLTESPLDELLDQAETLPFMADCRVLVGKNALFLTSTNRSKVEHDLDRFQSYLQNPSSHAVLLLLVPAGKLDERKKIVKQVKQQAVVIPCQPLDKDALGRWVQRRAQARGLALTAPLLELLVERVGRQLSRLEQEVEKLAQYAGKGPLTREDVERLVPRTLEEDVFTMVDGLLEGRSEQVMRTYYDLLEKKEEPLKMLGLLAYQFRLLLQVDYYWRRGYTEAHIAKVLGAHPYPVKRACRLLQKKDSAFADVLRDLLQQLAQLDRAMKTGRTQEERVADLEVFLLLASHRLKGKRAVAPR
nr:DNA polymerase III subunit delta [Bacillota bacterium]